MKDYYTANSHNLTYTFLSKRLEECTFELGSERVTRGRLRMRLTAIARPQATFTGITYVYFYFYLNPFTPKLKNCILPTL